MYKYVMRRAVAGRPGAAAVLADRLRADARHAGRRADGPDGRVRQRRREGAAEAPQGSRSRPALPRAIPALGLADGEPSTRRLDLHQRGHPGRAEKAIPVTLELAALAMILGLLIAIPIGVLSATRQDTAVGLRGPRGGRLRPVAARLLARHARHHLRGDLVPLDPADRLRQLLGLAVEESAAVPAAGGRPRLPPLGGHHAHDALDRAGGAARGLRAHRLGQGPGRAASSSTSTR